MTEQTSRRCKRSWPGTALASLQQARSSQRRAAARLRDEYPPYHHSLTHSESLIQDTPLDCHSLSCSLPSFPSPISFPSEVLLLPYLISPISSYNLSPRHKPLPRLAPLPHQTGGDRCSTSSAVCVGWAGDRGRRAAGAVAGRGASGPIRPWLVLEEACKGLPRCKESDGRVREQRWGKGYQMS